LSETPSSAAYRRPRATNSAGNRTVIAIGIWLAVWYHNDTSATAAYVDLIALTSNQSLPKAAIDPLANQAVNRPRNRGKSRSRVARMRTLADFLG
jgi:hypothetical protein